MNKTVAPITVTITDPMIVAKIEQVARMKKQPVEVVAEKALMEAAAVALGLKTGLSPKEAAMRLNCHRNTVFNLIRRRAFPGLYYEGPRRPRIPLADIEALSEQTVALN